MPQRKSQNLSAPVFGFRKTRSGVPFSPWDADAGETLLASPSVDLDLLFRRSLVDRTHELEAGGAEQGQVVAGEVVIDEVMSGEVVSSEVVSGEVVSGGVVSGTRGEVSQVQYASHPSSRSSDRSHSPPSPGCSIGTASQGSCPRSLSVSLFSEPIAHPPLSNPSATCSESGPPSRAGASADAQTRGAVQPDGLTKEEYRKKKRREKQRSDRRANREKAQKALGDTLKASARRYRATSSVIKAPDFEATPANVHIAKTGVIGRASRSLPKDRKSMPLKSALKLGFRYVKWSGDNSCVVVDSHKHGFTMLASHPNDPRWPDIINRATARFVWAQQQLAGGNSTPPDHRRGGYWSLNTGFSIGGGQPRVENLAHSAREQRILDILLNDPDIRRIANFASGSLHTHAPAVYNYYEETMNTILASDPSLRRNFVNNVFAAATFNLGPRAVTRVHLDHLNLAYGLCAVTALGNYDHTKGGHLVLWDAKLIIEFPPGCTILLPSAIIRHSNVDIGRGETRYSLTQYSAGGLFRWVRCGFRSQKDHIDDGFDMQKEYEQWKTGYNMYPIVEQ